MVAIYSYNPCTGQFHSDPPRVYSGDEPHYLIKISSLIVDGDLDLGNNYESARRGGMDAGHRFIANSLGHHTLIVDRRTGESGLWVHTFGPESEPCDKEDPTCVGFRRVSQRFPDFTPNNPNFVERPWHPFLFPAVVALLLAGTRQEALEAKAIYVVVLISWLAGLVTYACALKLGLSRNWALGTVAVLYFASPWLVYSHQLFAMTFLGLLLASALLAFLYGRFTMAAVLITLASVQSEAFVIIIPAWTLYLYFTKQKRAAWLFAATGITAVVAASMINRLLLGSVSLRGLAYIFHPVLWNAFVEPERGLFLFVPWCLVVFLFLAALLIGRGRDRRHEVIVIAAGVLPIAAILALMPETGGFCYGPRFWVPLLPWLAILFVIAAKAYWNFKPLWLRPILFVLIGISTAIAATAAVANYSAVAFWYEPPWYAAKAFLLSNNPSDEGVLCPGRKTEFSIGRGCGETAMTRATYTNPRAIRANSLAIVSRLACAVQIVEGTEVLRMRLFDRNGETENVSIVAGRDSSEWSYDCEPSLGAVRHRQAQVFSSYPASLGNQPCEGHRYLTTLRFSKLSNVKEIQFEWMTDEAAIILDRVSLTDETTGDSHPIDPAQFKP